jgi:serine/threonine-protein kinase HipA
MAAPTERLSVYLNERFLGLLDARPPALAFAYDQAYLASADARPISLSLPLREEPFEPEAARAFFAGLLPEGPERERIARYYRLSAMLDHGRVRAPEGFGRGLRRRLGHPARGRDTTGARQLGLPGDRGG